MDQVVELVGGGLLSTRPTPSSFLLNKRNTQQFNPIFPFVWLVTAPMSAPGLQMLPSGPFCGWFWPKFGHEIPARCPQLLHGWQGQQAPFFSIQEVMLIISIMSIMSIILIMSKMSIIFIIILINILIKILIVILIIILIIILLIILIITLIIILTIIFVISVIIVLNLVLREGFQKKRQIMHVS